MDADLFHARAVAALESIANDVRAIRRSIDSNSAENPSAPHPSPAGVLPPENASWGYWAAAVGMPHDLWIEVKRTPMERAVSALTGKLTAQEQALGCIRENTKTTARLLADVTGGGVAMRSTDAGEL